MNRAFLILALLSLIGCDKTREGHTIRVAACVEGRVAPCSCADGRMGTRIFCLADNQFSMCQCTGPLPDAGEDEDGGLAKDAGDEEDGSAGQDVGFFDSGPDFDSGGGDVDSGPRDVGFDGGFDAGDGGFDSGFDGGFDAGDSGRPDATPDGGFNLDGGFPFGDGGLPLPDGGLGDICALIPGLGGPCSADIDCNTIVPIGFLICENFVCVEGCLCTNGPICVSPQVCDQISGRCF